MNQTSNETRIPIRNKSIRKKHTIYFLLLVSPITWLKCFGLIFYRTRARTLRIAFLQYFVLLLVLLLMAVSAYLFYSLTDDSGQYILYLSNVAYNMTSMAEGRQQFNELIWRTVLKTFFLGVIFGLIQACNFFLAAQWRQRLCDRFHELLLRSPNGCVLYDMSQTNEDIPKVITNNVKQFTSNFATVLFGSMFFMSALSICALIITTCVVLVRQTSGDASGILICFVAFIFCVLIILPGAQIYNWSLVKQSKLKGHLRGYMQRIQTNAECIVLYASQLVELKYIEQLMLRIRNSILYESIGFGAINFTIQLIYCFNGVCTYTIPSAVLFFIQSIPTPEKAQMLLAATPFYSLLISLLSQLMIIMEYALVAVTMGDYLWMMLNRLEKLTEEHQRRITYEEESGIRQENANMLVLSHLNISVPDAISAPLLQSDVNLEAMRGECVLIFGPSGCGKTSLFRICAGLLPIDAKQIILPERRHLLFIPQRPYLPIGSLRFQALFLLGEQSNISDKDILKLFQSVNLGYLLEKHALDTVIDWSMILSLGEQQRLSFVRVLALFTLMPNKNQLIQETLLLFDESTSAIDVKTEHDIYEHLIQLGIWFITISHRSSLLHVHSKILCFSQDKTQQQQMEKAKFFEDQVSITSIDKDADDDNENELSEQENNESKFMNIKQLQSNSDISYTNKKNISTWKLIIDVLKFIHLPFQPNDTKLKIATIITWLLTLGILGITVWCYYIFTERTAELFGGLAGYASGTLSLDEAKQTLKSKLAAYIVLAVAVPVVYGLTVSGGRILSALYTRRQMAYLAHLLLDNSMDNHGNNLLYHSRHLSSIPNFLSHEIAELNNEIFHFTFGHIYYTGALHTICMGIALGVLLGKQNGGSNGNLVVFLLMFGLFIIVNILTILFQKWNIHDEDQFAQFVSAHKRVDLQGEQIAFSGEDVRMVEENELRQKLDSSVRSQTRVGYSYSIIIGIVRLSMISVYLINFGVPAAIFFHTWYNQGLADPTTANTFIALSTYMYNLYFCWNAILCYAEPLMRIESIGTRVVTYLEQLRQIKMHHHRLAIEQQEQGRRVYIEPNVDRPSVVFKQVDVRIPQSSDVLVSNINLTLFPSDNLIITGPSGCGKSTLIRLLAGLIPNESNNNNSVLSIIPRQNTIFLCQQLHLIRGTLREQLSYLRETHGLDSLTDDSRAQQILNEFGLGYLIDRYTMDGDRQDWSNLLSVGEQQRLVMATAFLVGTQTIKLFVVDEITSACDKRTEKIIYEYLQRSNVQFISVSHRKRVIKYHSCRMTINTKHEPLILPQWNGRF